MKKVLVGAALMITGWAATAHAGVDFRVNIGVPVVAPPRPAVVAYPSEQIVVTEAPQFIYSPDLGAYVSVGSPYDIAYIDDCYYLYSGGNWYMSSSYRGPWTFVQHRRLPRVLRKHRYEEICHMRDMEYGTYMNDRDHYRGRWYRPEPVRVAGPRWEERRRWEEHREREWDRRRHWEDRRDAYWDRR